MIWVVALLSLAVGGIFAVWWSNRGRTKETIEVENHELDIIEEAIQAEEVGRSDSEAAAQFDKNFPGSGAVVLLCLLGFPHLSFGDEIKPTAVLPVGSQCIVPATDKDLERVLIVEDESSFLIDRRRLDGANTCPGKLQKAVEQRDSCLGKDTKKGYTIWNVAGAAAVGILLGVVAGIAL